MAASGLGDRRVTGALRVPGVPVFLYHELLRDGARAPSGEDPRYCLSASTFQTHLSLLRADGVRVATLDDLWAGESAAHGYPARSAVLTFDDGRLSDLEVAFPLLAEAAVRAEFFVNTATLGTSNRLGWSQLRIMHGAGMSIQSHSHDHVILVGLPAPRLRQQLSDSRRRLEDGLGEPVRYLAAPYGLVDRRVVSAALHAGYRAVCTSGEWMARPGARTISRLALHSTTPLSTFRRLLHGTPGLLTRRRLRVGLAYLPKRVLLRVRRQSLERHV